MHVSAPASIYVGPAQQSLRLIVGATILCLLLFLFVAWLLYTELRNHRDRQATLLEVQRMEVLGRLTGGIAHDFNNLLTPIMGGLELIRRRVGEDERAMRHVELAYASAERARTLVAQLLSYSRRQTLASTDVDVTRLLVGLSDLLQQSLTPTIDLKLTSPERRVIAHADRAQLELAILNLAINARDAMPDGGELSIQWNAVSATEAGLPDGRAYVKVTVTDEGDGMDEQTLRQATEPFFTTKPKERGTGLGLSMVHGFAAQSGGQFRLASSVGAGTVATLLLPAGEDRIEEVAPRPPLVSLPSKNILLVDDEEAVRTTTAQILSAAGHHVTEAASVDQALLLLRSDNSINAVVTDFLMPGKTGADLIATLRADAPGMPVLMITGYISQYDAVPSDVLKLRKPFTADELLGCFGRAIEARLEAAVL